MLFFKGPKWLNAENGELFNLFVLAGLISRLYIRSFHHIINCGWNGGHVKLPGPWQAGRPDEAQSSLFRCSAQLSHAICNLPDAKFTQLAQRRRPTIPAKARLGGRRPKALVNWRHQLQTRSCGSSSCWAECAQHLAAAAQHAEGSRPPSSPGCASPARAAGRWSCSRPRCSCAPIRGPGGCPAKICGATKVDICSYMLGTVWRETFMDIWQLWCRCSGGKLPLERMKRRQKIQGQ